MKKPGKGRTTLRTSSFGKDYFTIIAQITLIAALIFRIPLGYMIGDKGMACFGTANEILAVMAGTAAYGLSQAAAVQVRYRMKRGQVKSAGKILRGALLIGGGIGLLLSLLLVFTGYALAEHVMHLAPAGMAVVWMAPAVFFSILTGVFRGYFQGNGSKRATMHSQVLYVLFLYLAGLAGAAALHGYGQKVAALLQNEDFAGAYGAMGASIGLVSASFFSFFHMLILYFVYRNNQKKQAVREQSRNQETMLGAVKVLTGTGILYALYWFSFHAMTLLDQYLFLAAGARTPMEEGMILSEYMGQLTAWWGAYYGKYAAVIGTLGGFVSMACLLPIRRIIMTLEREANRAAREKLGIWIHQCASIAIPAAVFLGVLAQDLADVLFKGNNEQMISWLRVGSVTVVFSVFAVIFTEVLMRNRKLLHVVCVGAAAFLLHAGMAVLLVSIGKMGIVGVIISEIAFYAVVTLAGFFLVSRLFQYEQEWIKCFALTIVVSAISGLLAMLLDRLFHTFLNSLLSMALSLAVAIAVYMLLLVITRAFRREELDEMVGGRLLIMLSELLHYT